MPEQDSTDRKGTPARENVTLQIRAPICVFEKFWIAMGHFKTARSNFIVVLWFLELPAERQDVLYLDYLHHFFRAERPTPDHEMTMEPVTLHHELAAMLRRRTRQGRHRAEFVGTALWAAAKAWVNGEIDMMCFPQWREKLEEARQFAGIIGGIYGAAGVAPPAIDVTARPPSEPGTEREQTMRNTKTLPAPDLAPGPARDADFPIKDREAPTITVGDTPYKLRLVRGQILFQNAPYVSFFDAEKAELIVCDSIDSEETRTRGAQLLATLYHAFNHHLRATPEGERSSIFSAAIVDLLDLLNAPGEDLVARLGRLLDYGPED